MAKLPAQPPGPYLLTPVQIRKLLKKGKITQQQAIELYIKYTNAVITIDR